jgi:hypothetical protein
MRIAVIGKGNIGGTLGGAFERAGHEVAYGSCSGGLAEALAGAEAIVLALPAGAVGDLLADHGSELDGKLVVDATNRVGAPVANAAAAIRSAAPEARYVRAFNTLGWENFADPDFGDGPADMFFSAAPADRSAAEELIGAVGLRPVWVGEDKQDVVDGLLPLWFSLTQARGGNRRIALRLIEK